MAQDCQRPILDNAILIREEASMCSAPVLAVGASRVEGLDSYEFRPEACYPWEAETLPRLQASDLSNPEVYYRRLENYIMSLK
jgi:hypothetical protein